MTTPTTDTKPTQFRSFSDMQRGHAGLVQFRRSQGDTAQLYRRINAFIWVGTATGVVLDKYQERQTAQSMLDYWDNVLRRANQQVADATLAEFDLAAAPELDDDLCPYVGLFAFQEFQQHLFHGRQQTINTLVTHLQQYRLLAVTGPSGCGKSSLVMAGLLPELKKGGMGNSRSWHYYPRIVPGSSPTLNLFMQITTPEQRQNKRWFWQQVGRFQRDSHFLQDYLATMKVETAVLFIDQFEEIFTLCQNKQERQVFVDNLLTLTTTPRTRHTVILTMRTDYESYITTINGFEKAFNIARQRVLPLDAAELRATIEAPADGIGLRFAEGVVDNLVQDVLGEPAALPLLQFTLLKLWSLRERNRVTLAAYRQLGGGRVALAHSADEFYNSLLHEEQRAVQRIMLQVIRPSSGLEITSKRVRRSAIYEIGLPAYRLKAVLQKLLDARLLRLTPGQTADDDQIEVAHEALIRNWPRLVEWLEAERETLRRRERLREDAEQWALKKRDPSLLLQKGFLLEEALSYINLTAQEKEYVDASQTAVTAQERARETQRQHELRNSRRLSIALVGIVILLIVVAFLVWQDSSQTVQEKEVAAAEADATRTIAETKAASAETSVAHAEATGTSIAIENSMAQSQRFASDEMASAAVAAQATATAWTGQVIAAMPAVQFSSNQAAQNDFLSARESDLTYFITMLEELIPEETDQPQGLLDELAYNLAQGEINRFTQEITAIRDENLEDLEDELVALRRYQANSPLRTMNISNFRPDFPFDGNFSEWPVNVGINTAVTVFPPANTSGQQSNTFAIWRLTWDNQTSAGDLWLSIDVLTNEPVAPTLFLFLNLPRNNPNRRLQVTQSAGQWIMLNMDGANQNMGTPLIASQPTSYGYTIEMVIPSTLLQGSSIFPGSSLEGVLAVRDGNGVVLTNVPNFDENDLDTWGTFVFSQ